MKTIMLEGCCDLHIHAAPDCYDRIGNDIEIARAAKAAGMKVIGLKSVYESTASRAWHTMQIVDGIQVIGGIVLDYHVGGLNPLAVEPCLKMGGKIVWLPTYHAAAHGKAFGAVGEFGYAKDNNTSNVMTGLTILDNEGNIKESVKVIVHLCQENHAILASGHISTDESVALAKYCQKEKFYRLVITHPFFKVPNMSVEEAELLLNLGAYLEFCSTEVCPIPGGGDLQKYVRLINKRGSSRIILGSDAGHNRMTWPTEQLRTFAQQIAYMGVPIEHVMAMIRDNYEGLLE